MASYVVDTNVLELAENPHHPAGLACHQRCAELLKSLRVAGTICLDDRRLILTEYIRHFGGVGAGPAQGGIGRAFVQWLADNMGSSTPLVCKAVVTPTNSARTEFKEFPRDRALKGFHFNDRKFVAVARSCGDKPPIAHATDKGWRRFESTLRKNGVAVLHLCGEERGGCSGSDQP